MWNNNTELCYAKNENITTIDVERFAELNIRGSSPMKFLRKYFYSTLATSVHYIRIAKNSWENFHGELIDRENNESLASQIFPHLRYVFSRNFINTVVRK